MSNPANATTLTRLLLVPQFVLLVWLREDALAIFYISLFLLLDAFDGYFARWFSCGTLFGKNFDLATDALGLWSLVTILFLQHRFPDALLLAMIVPLVLIGTGFVLDLMQHRDHISGNESRFWKGAHGGSWFALMICALLGGVFLVVAWLFYAMLIIVGVRYLLKVVRRDL